MRRLTARVERLERQTPPPRNLLSSPDPVTQWLCERHSDLIHRYAPLTESFGANEALRRLSDNLEQRVAAGDAAELPRTIQGRILKLLERLASCPDVSGVKSLSGELAGAYRLRTGDYRLQFRVNGDTVRIERIGHRDRSYEG